MDMVKNMLKKFKENLNKLKFRKWFVVLIVAMILAIILCAFGKNNIKFIGLLMILLSGTCYFVLSILYLFVHMHDDMWKIIFIFACILFYVYIIVMYCVLANKISSNFPEFKEDLMQLFINSFSSIVPAIIGIGGTYFAAIYGGKKAIEATEKQLRAQAEDEENKVKENKGIAIRIISKLLKEEIINNVNNLHKICFSENEIQQGENYDYTEIKRYLQFKDYDNVKYEIIKYCDEDIVEDVIDIYGIFSIFKRHSNINEMDEEEVKKINMLRDKYNSFLKKIENEVN